MSAFDPKRTLLPMRKLWTLVILSLASLAYGAAAWAQDFKPYPQPKITAEQWQAYFDEVSAKHGSTRKEAPEAHFVSFSDAATTTQYTFTQPGNAAHPAWVTRQVIQEGSAISVRQIGYFAGDEPAFAQLYAGFQRMNDQMRRNFRRPAQ